MSQRSIRLFLIRCAFRYLGPLFPTLFSHWAYSLWTRTHRRPEPAREKRMRLRGGEYSLTIKDQNIKFWSWGDGPLVLLVHGWNGRGMQMASFVDPLLKSGYRVMTFDAPGHGLSSGQHSTITDIRDVIMHIGEQFGPVYAVIAHSFGVACLSASFVEGFQCRATIAISSPGGYQSLVEGYAGFLQMPVPVTERFKSIILNRIGNTFWDDFSPASAMKVPTPPCLIVHDRNDNIVHWQSAEHLARQWPNAELFLTEGLGHLRLLRNGKLTRHIVRFLDTIPPASSK